MKNSAAIIIIVLCVAIALFLFKGAKNEEAAVNQNQIICFMPTTVNNYIAEWARGADQEAERLGYDLVRFENNFKQEEQDVQVQQQIASNAKPAFYIWWPTDNAGGLASLKALAETGVPVVQANQLPIPGYDELWVAYAGVDDKLNGRVSGEMMIEARDKLKAGGHEMHSPGGNCLVITFPVGYQAGADRVEAFKEAIGGTGIDVLDQQPAGFDETTGYNVGAQLITANRAKGIDLFYANNDALALGVIHALEEAGYQPGKDVMVVGGTCHGNLDALREEKQYGTGLQAALLEGIFTVQTVHKYIAAGKTGGEVYRAPADPDSIPETTGVPARFNFIPNPPVRSGEIDTVKLWGYKFDELATY
jgi:ABC-type sugar transport system substrate-binding protein